MDTNTKSFYKSQAAYWEDQYKATKAILHCMAEQLSAERERVFKLKEELAEANDWADRYRNEIYELKGKLYDGKGA